MDLEEKYKDIIEAYTRTTKENDEFDDGSYSYRKTSLRVTLNMGSLTRIIESLIREIKIRIGLKGLIYLSILFVVTYTVYSGLKNIQL